MFCPNPECPDFEASGVPGEYRDDLTTCPVCGAGLVAWDLRDQAPPGGDPGAEVPGELEPVVETADGAETDIVRSILNGAGIPYSMQGPGERRATPLGHDPFRLHALGSGVRFLVPADRAEEARALLTTDDGEP